MISLPSFLLDPSCLPDFHKLNCSGTESQTNQKGKTTKIQKNTKKFHLFEIRELLLPSQGLEVVERVDVVESVAMERLRHICCLRALRDCVTIIVFVSYCERTFGNLNLGLN